MTAWLRKRINSLAVRLLLPAALMMVVMVVTLTTVVTRTYTDTILQQEAAKTQSAFSIAAGSVTSLMDTARALGANVMQTDQVQRYAAESFARPVDRVLARQGIVEAFDLLLLQNPDVHGLLFMRDNGTVFGTLLHRTYFMEDAHRFLSEDLIAQIRRGSRGRTRWIGPVSGQELYRLGGDYEKAPEQVMLGVSYNRSIVYGTVYSIVVMDTTELSGLMEMLSDGRSSFHLIGADGVQLASAGSAQIHPEVWTEVLTGGSAGSTSVETENGEWSHASWRRIDSLGWYLVRELPMAEYDRTVNELKRFVLLSALAVFAAAMLLYMLWLSSFMHSFKALRLAIRRLGEGQLEARIEKPFAVTEFEEIRREFNEMNRELESLIQTTRAMERSQLELELRALQTQLSPHMIFNSITAIRWMATMLGAERVSDMLMELSEMLRPVFRDWAIEWTLEEELKHLTHYSNLLDLRYGNNFTLKVDVPEEMKDLKLPRFTLQPLIENSCEHGGASSAKLHVTVKARMEGRRAVLTVRDDGLGIDEETVDVIRSRLAEGGRTRHVGLYSVYNRLRICMGDASQMNVNNLPEGGAEVTVSWNVDEYTR